VTVTTGADSDSGCGYPFVEKERYLVYAAEKDLSVSLCGETKLLSEAGADLEALGNGEKPKDAGVLSDASGGIPASAAIPSAGAAVIGSLLLAARLLRAV
jgi:hypothetical protein